MRPLEAALQTQHDVAWSCAGGWWCLVGHGLTLRGSLPPSLEACSRRSRLFWLAGPLASPMARIRGRELRRRYALTAGPFQTEFKDRDEQTGVPLTCAEILTVTKHSGRIFRGHSEQ